MRAILAVIAAGCIAVGCTDTVLRDATIGNTRALVTTADLRIITERPNRLGGPTLICAEPSPDVAKALSTASQLAASVRTPSSVSGNGSIGAATAEQLAELAGRVPGLLALRDGLYRVCEAFANGALGSDGYAVVLSRYGDLLTTLLLADAAAGADKRTLAVL